MLNNCYYSQLLSTTDFVNQFHFTDEKSEIEKS